MASVSAPIKKLKYIKVMFRLLMPKVMGISKKMAMAATAGMVKPILASAEPRAKFKLLCNRLARAARIAAKDSGSSTNIAMAIPTTVLGAPMALTPASMAGLSSFARATTAIKEIKSKIALMAVFRLLGFCA